MLCFVLFSSMVRQVSKHIVVALLMHGCVIYVRHDDRKKANSSWLSLLVWGETSQLVVSFSYTAKRKWKSGWG